MGKIEAMKKEILRDTYGLLASFAEKFAGSPDDELRAWLHVAVRREAMVSRVYNEGEREKRLAKEDGAAGKVAWEALGLICRQEREHTKSLELLIAEDFFREAPLKADILIWWGNLEGSLFSALTARGAGRFLARAFATLGAALVPSTVPEFVKDLSELSIDEFFLVCAVLEATACQAYKRMAHLARELSAAHAQDRYHLPLESLARDVPKKVLEETFHEAAFGELAAWVSDGRFDRKLSESECAHRLANLLPPGSRTTRDLRRRVVATDGGLGPLFRRLGVLVEVG